MTIKGFLRFLPAANFRKWRFEPNAFSRDKDALADIIRETLSS
jgi:hypothetical protein